MLARADLDECTGDCTQGMTQLTIHGTILSTTNHYMLDLDQSYRCFEIAAFNRLGHLLAMLAHLGLGRQS